MTCSASCVVKGTRSFSQYGRAQNVPIRVDRQRSRKNLVTKNALLQLNSLAITLTSLGQAEEQGEEGGM